MRISLATAVLLFTLLQPAVEAIFLGPIAVGVALGAIAVTKGLILGSILSRSRTSHRNGRGYTSYNRQSHYSQPRTYYSHYTKPKVYYYSSNSYSHHGKRSVPEYSEEELSRMIRAAEENTMTGEWYMDMVEKDQDDCSKRLICEISYKKATGKALSEIEKDILLTHRSQLLSLILLHRLESTGSREESDVSSSGDAKHQLMILLP